MLRSLFVPVRTAVGVGILLVLLGNILVTQASREERTYCFAMFAEVTPYDIQAVIAGARLTPDEIQQRYGYRAVGVETRSIQHIKNVITAVEARAAERAQVRVRYSTNGGPQREWIAP